MMHFRVRPGEIDPDDSRTSVVRQSKFRLPVAIQVRHPAALSFDRMRDQVTLPHDVGLLRILVPIETIGHPPDRHYIRCTVMVHIDCPLATVRDKLAYDFYGPVLAHLPLSTLRTRILVPECTAQDVRKSSSVHVESSDASGMIGPEPVDEESGLWLVSRSVASIFV